MYTCTYTHIPTHTCTYMHIPDTPNLKRPYLGNQWAVRPEPKNRFNNRPFLTNCAGLGHMERIRDDMAAQQTLVRGVNLGAPEHPKYASDFSARGCVLHNAGGRTSDPSLSLPGRSWPILRRLQDGPSHKSVGGGRLWCTLQAKINIWFQHTQAGPVLCWREGDSAKFWRVQSIRADSMAVARQVPTPILEGKIEKSGRRGGLGWGQKVVGHMPWGALSGSPRVLGHEEVFWGCCGGFRAPVVQCMQYLQILMAYWCIHAYTCIYLQYLHIPIYRYIQEATKYLLR